MAYWQRSPYESRVFNPSLSFYSNDNLYKSAFYLQRKLPMLAAYHLTKVLPGTKKLKSDLQ